MKKSSSHQIDTLARSTVEEILSPWVLNEFHRDYGKDFHLEIVEANKELTGTACFIQLKGTTRAAWNAKQTHATFRLDNKDAVYFWDKVQLPVFLFLVDVSTRNGYWVFIQDYLKTAAIPNWRAKSKIPIKVPKANSIRNIPELRQAIETANTYMLARNPVSIPDAISARKSKLESVDPRIKVKIMADEEGTHVTLLPQEPITTHFRFNMQPDGMKTRVDQLIKMGLPVKFDQHEITLLGSPLFDEFPKGPLTLSISHNQSCSMSVYALDNAGGVISQLENLPGRVTGGTQEMRIRTELESCPLSLDLGLNSEASQGPVRFNFSTKKWGNGSVRTLPYFDQLSRFFAGIREAARIRFESTVNGQQITLGQMSGSQLRLMRAFSGLMELLSMARVVCDILNIDRHLPLSMDRGRQLQVIQLHSILARNGSSRNISGEELDAQVPRKHLEQAISSSDIRNKAITILGPGKMTQMYWDHPVTIDGVFIELENVKIRQTKRDLKKILDNTTVDLVPVLVKGMKNSREIIRRHVNHMPT